MRYAAWLLIPCLLTSCATVTRGRDEVISVDSNPSGAQATIACAGNVSASGETPARLSIPRIADGCRLQIAKSGMQSQSLNLARGINSHYWLNFVFFAGVPVGGVVWYAGNTSQESTGGVVAVGGVVLGITGFIVDHATGAMYDHDPNVIKVTLQPEH